MPVEQQEDRKTETRGLLFNIDQIDMQSARLGRERRRNVDRLIELHGHEEAHRLLKTVESER